MTEVTVRSRDGLTQEITLGRHTLLADEQRPAGADEGPDPYQLLLSALGACTAMTVKLYAERKGWPLESVEVTLEQSKVHAEDCAECDTREGFVDRISKRLTFHGQLSAEQRQRLAEIAERCPVQRTLQRAIVISQDVV
jgi:putative redox protein